MKQIFAVLIAAGAIASTGFNPWAVDDGVGAEYWQHNSLIYGRVDRVTGTNQVMMRPLGTLSGLFDSGTIANLSVTFNTSQFAPTFPAVGDNVLVVLADRRSWTPPVSPSGYVMPYSIIKYLPIENFGFVRVNDFSDPVVAKTLKTVNKLRKDEATAGPGDAGCTYSLCLFYGEMVSVSPQLEPGGAGFITVRSIKLLSGVLRN